MSTTEQEPERPQSPEEWLSDRRKETKVMARMRKRDVLNETQAGNAPTTGELAAIDRLEAKIAASERIALIRERTRTRARP